MLAASRGLALARPSSRAAAPTTTTTTGVPQRRSQLMVARIKPTKASDFAGLSDDEIVSKIGSLKRELASTRFLFKTRGVAEMKAGEQQAQPDPEKMPKGHISKHLRLQVAQLWTVWRQRQIAAGIDSRTSKKTAPGRLSNFRG